MTVHTPIREDDVRRSYAKWAGHYDFTFALFGRRYVKQIVKRINDDMNDGGPRKNLLDVGTGTGLSLPHFDDNLQIIGIDLSADMLARARARVKQRKLSNVSNLFEMDASDLKFIDGFFNVVIATFVMSVVPNPQKVLKEMARVTRPGGRIYLFNHFKADAADKKFLSMVERRFAPASGKIGFHSDFCRSQLNFKRCKLTVIDEQDFGPLDMFKLITLEKATD